MHWNICSSVMRHRYVKGKEYYLRFLHLYKSPKNKYLISLYRSETLNVVAVFPTSRKRSGSLSPRHGKNYRGQDIVSYVFEANRCIGKKYCSDEDSSFPLVTTIPFDYCFREGEQENLLRLFESAEVVGALSDEEYINLIYAFSKSPINTTKVYIYL